MPNARTRSATTLSVGGFIRDSQNQIVGSGTIIDKFWRMDDVWGKKARKTPPALRGTLEPSSLSHTRYFQHPLQAWRRTGSIRFDAFPASALFVHDSAIPMYTPGRTPAQDNAFYALLLLERTNPFRSEFSVPVFIKELIDIGAMFKLAADTFRSFVGNAYLNYRFGWVSFVQDIRTLGSIIKSIDRRIREFNSLKKHGGLRRNIQLGGHSGQLTNPNMLLNSTWGWFPRAKITHSASVKVRGSVRWIPTRDFREDLRKLNLFSLAIRKVLDLDNPDPATVWEMIPFSWLADYFTSIGSYLRANNGAVKVQPYDICLIREYTCYTHGTLLARDPTMDQESSNCNGSCVVTRRDVITAPPAFPSIHFELLSASQWQVVAALVSKWRT